MPGITYRPWQLEWLDRFINERQPDELARFREVVAAGRVGGGFGEGSPFSGDDERSQRHWLDDWVGEPPHRGGAYWPDAADVDVAEILQHGLLASVDRVIATGKVHSTVWVHGDGFGVAVQESRQVVTLIIRTPPPQGEATGAGETVAGLVAHMELQRSADGRLTFAGWSRPAERAGGRGAQILRDAGA